MKWLVYCFLIVLICSVIVYGNFELNKKYRSSIYGLWRGSYLDYAIEIEFKYNNKCLS